tara:strand:- start:5203 stop:6057 length:855 start_codon:yes stop_codon:yes gene_type:complete
MSIQNLPEHLQKAINRAKLSLIAAPQDYIPFIDHTLLSDNISALEITNLCAEAKKHGTASVCVPPKWVRLAAQELEGSDTFVATVIDFPHGQGLPQDAVLTAQIALKDGAKQLDLVMDYESLHVNPDDKEVAKRIQAVKSVIAKEGSQANFKVILKAGVYQDAELLKKAARIALENGADSVKTSTGKAPIREFQHITEKDSATPETAAILMSAVADFNDANGTQRGVKISGGVSNIEDCAFYMALAKDIMGEESLTPEFMRFGASASLLNSLIGSAAPNQPSPY